MSTTFRHVLPFGAELQGTHTQFRFWAPAQNEVRLICRRNEVEETLPMARGAEGWFSVTAEAPAGTRYYYQLREGTRVPDPASRFQPQDVHGPSEVIDPAAYRWRNGAWRGRPWEETVLYESHVGCFTPEGTFDSFRRRLDDLAELGVTAVELMPLADFEGKRNWGYDGVLPFAPDSTYGRPDDLKRLIDEAHDRSLMVFLDVVYNHFGPSGNYLGLYAPSFFTDRYKTPWGPAINFEDIERAKAAAVRQFFIENAKYWLQEYRFDGLRFDAVHAILDASHPHFLLELAAAVRESVGRDRHVHLVLENADNVSRYLDRATHGHYNAQWNDDFHHAAHVIATGESHGYYIDFATTPVTDMAKSLATGFVYQGEPSAHWQGRARGERSGQLPATAFVNFLQNHDQIGNRADARRLASVTDAAPLRALTALTLLAPAIPMLFMGEEWASRRRFDFFVDFAGDLAAAVRKGRQDEFAQMRHAEPGGEEAAHIDPNAAEIYRQSQLDWDERVEPRSLSHLTLVKRLLTLRHTHIVPRLANLRPGGTFEVRDGRALRVRWALADGALALVANLSPEPIANLGWRVEGTDIFATEGFQSADAIDALPPWSVCVRITSP